MTFATADLYDEYEEKLQIATPMFNDYGGNLKFCACRAASGRTGVTGRAESARFAGYSTISVPCMPAS